MKSIVVLMLGMVLSTGLYAEDYFMGDPCTIDCSGHEAGYQWAENHMGDYAGCFNSNSTSFTEGCTAFYDKDSSSSGYNWAENNEISDVDDCNSAGMSSFTNGCEDYVEEQQNSLDVE